MTKVSVAKKHESTIMTRVSAQSASYIKTDLSQTALAGLRAPLQRALSAGGIILFPTETFYGLAVDAHDTKAVEKLERLKGGRVDKNFPLIAESMAALDQIARLPEAFVPLAERFWPGPLTFSLKPLADLPAGVVSVRGEIGVRVSSHPGAKHVAHCAGGLITATSANFAGDKPCLELRDVPKALLDTVDLIIDAGPCPGGEPSTIVGFENGEGVLWRQGAISLVALQACVDIHFRLSVV